MAAKLREASNIKRIPLSIFFIIVFKIDLHINFGSVAYLAGKTYLDTLCPMNETEFYTKLLALPNGANNVTYLGKRYLLRKETLLNGKLLKVYAEELGGNDIVSGNYYPSIKTGTLKPCEMSDKKVIDFVLHAITI